MNTDKKVVVIAGPSGSGKDSVIQGVLNQFPQCTRLTTATTREPRPGEVHAQDYYFISKDEFLSRIADGSIPEHWHAPDTDRYYGTYLPDLEQKLAEGKVVITQQQIEAVRFFKKNFGALTIAIEPGSLEELRGRIVKRHDMDEREITERLEKAKLELAENKAECAYTVINADGKLNDAVDATVDILRKEGYIE